MKFFPTAAVLICVSASALHAAGVYVNGQAARAMIGQVEFTNESNLSPTNQIIGGVGGLAYSSNGQLWLADGNVIGNVPINNRVLGFDTTAIPSSTSDLLSFAGGTANCRLCGFTANTVIGQADFNSNTSGRAQVATAGGAGSMNIATAVATDGTHLVVADSYNNRVLIWNTLPSGQNQPPNVVLGQPDYTTLNNPANISASSMRIPNGVWIQNGKLYVADTGNSRVLIWNSIPTSNNQPANIVLGQPNFSSNASPSLTSNPATISAAANLLWNPTSVSVTPDGTHLIVADFGYSRVLIWNSIPSQNQQPADVVLGQGSMTGSAANDNTHLCASTGTDSSNNPTYPSRCEKTMDHPRFAIADNTYLYVADTGNDRVLLFNIANGLPATNDPAANLVLGQPNFTTDVDVTNTDLITSAVDNTGAVYTTPFPLSLTLDGTNLYVADPVNHRVLIFTPADIPVSGNQVLNNASKILQQEGLVVIAAPGTITANDTVTVTISGTNYTYTVKSGDKVADIVKGVVAAINANSGDPNATAYADTKSNTVVLLSKNPNADLNTIAYSASSSNTANETATAAGAYLAGGNSGTLAPGTLFEIDNPNADSSGNVSDALAFSDFTLTEPANSQLPQSVSNPSNPTSLVEVFVDGFAVPIYSVSPTQVVAQIPYSFENSGNGYSVDRNSISIYVRRVHGDGRVTITTAAPAAFTEANPGLYAQSGSTEPRSAINAFHQSGNPSSAVQISGTTTANDAISITVGSNTYKYTVSSTDTIYSIAQQLAAVMANDPSVTASAAAGAIVILTAKQSGAAGSGIAVSSSVTAAGSGTATETATTLNATTCCATTGTGAVTPQNPAQPNEVIVFTATGLGNVSDVNGNVIAHTTNGTDVVPAEYIAGTPYGSAVSGSTASIFGPQPNTATNFVNATVSGSSANVISAGLAPGAVGVYSVAIQMPSTLPTSGIASVYIAQNAFISNTVSIPVGTPVTGSTSTVYNGSAGKWASIQTSTGQLPPSTTTTPTPAARAGHTVTSPVYVPYVGGAFPMIPATANAAPSTLGNAASANAQATTPDIPVTASPTPSLETSAPGSSDASPLDAPKEQASAAPVQAAATQTPSAIVDTPTTNAKKPAQKQQPTAKPRKVSTHKKKKPASKTAKQAQQMRNANTQAPKGGA